MSNNTGGLNSTCPPSSWGNSPCSGYGTCENGVCVCSEWWTGVSDIVNLDGADCHLPIPLQSALWGITLLQWLRLTYVYVKAIRYQTSVYHMQHNRKKIRYIWQHRPLQILLLGFCVVNPSCIIVCIIKTFFPSIASIGHDPLITVAFAIFGSIGFINNTPVHIAQFDSVSSSLSIRGRQRKNLLRWYRVSSWVTSLWFAIVANGITIASLFVDPKSEVVPRSEGYLHQYLLIGRILATSAFMLASAILLLKVKHKLIAAVNELNPEVVERLTAPTSSHSSLRSGVGEVGRKSEETLKSQPHRKSSIRGLLFNMKAHTDGMIKAYFIMAVFYLICIAPPFWGYLSLVWVITSLKAGDPFVNPPALFSESAFKKRRKERNQETVSQPTLEVQTRISIQDQEYLSPQQKNSLRSL